VVYEIYLLLIQFADLLKPSTFAVTSYLNIDMYKFEPLQKDESRDQSDNSSNAYSNLGTLNGDVSLFNTRFLPVR